MNLSIFWAAVIAVRAWLRAASYVARRYTLPGAAAGLAAVAVLAPTAASISIGFGALTIGLVLTPWSAQRERVATAWYSRTAVSTPHATADGAALRRSPGWTWTPATAREVTYAILRIAAAPLALLPIVVALFGAVAMTVPLLLQDGQVVIVGATITTSEQAVAAALLGMAALIAGTMSVRATAAIHVRLVRWLLSARPTELAMQVVDLTRSRLRLVDAFDGERRRIERDLHDGAQQHLLALKMAIDHARVELTRGALDEVELLLDRAHRDVGHAMVEMRRLIRDIRPPALDGGLGQALEQISQTSPVPVTISLELDSRPEPIIEATLYFVVAEAVTNAARHADAREVRVHLHEEVAEVVLEVCDDGTGGADLRAGTGLAGLADRVSAVGGSLQLRSPPGGPTIVTAKVPRTIAALAGSAPFIADGGA